MCAVLENDTGRRQFTADPVGFSEVARFLGACPVGNQGFNLLRRKFTFCTAFGWSRLQESLRVTAQKPHQPGQRLQLRRQRRRFAAIDFGGQIKEHSTGLRRIEIVIHRRLETLRMRLIPIDRRIDRRHGLECGIKTRQRLPRIVEMRIRVIERAAVVRTQDEETNNFSVEFLEHLTNGEEIAQRLGHLFVVDAHKTVVHPVVNKLALMCPFRLGNLVLMMRKLEILTAAMNVKARPQQIGTHRRAFDVPARTAVTPRRCPSGFAFLGVLPENKIERIMLGLIDTDTLTGTQIVERLARKLTVAWKLAYREVHITVGRLVGQPVLFELADQIKHLWHIFRCARLVIRTLNAQRQRVLVHEANEPIRQFANRLVVLRRALDDFVIDIGDIAHVGHFEAARPHPPLNHVEDDQHARMADVAIVINRHSANVHANLAGFDRNKILLFPDQGVIDFQHLLAHERAALTEPQRKENLGFDALLVRIRKFGPTTLDKYNITMPQHAQTPSLARFSAIFLGLALSVSVSFAHAQTLPDIQRLMKQGQMPQALEKADSYIASKPKDAQGRFLRGLILTEMGRSADAIAVFTKLTEDFPELPEPYNNLAVLYAQQRLYDKARTALEMAIRTHPSYSIAHENLGDVYAKLASQAYDKALQLDSSNATTQTKLSMIKDLISTTSKPGSRPSTTQAAPETGKPVAAEPVAVAKPVEKTPEPPATGKAAEVKAPETKITEAKPAENKATEDKSREVPAAVESELTKAVQGWASAWSRKDVKAYLAYYAGDFQTPKGVPRKAWETERAQRIDKPGKLQVSVSDIKVSLANDKATVRFRQDYTSASLKSSAGKTLVFVKSGGRWLILQERVG